VSNIITNLISARDRLETMSDAISAMLTANFLSEKTRHFEDYVINSKMMYAKLQYASKMNDKSMAFWREIESERKNEISLLHYFKEMRNILEHGQRAPLNFEISASVSSNPENPTLLYSKSSLAFDLEPNLNDPSVKYTITLDRFRNARSGKWYEVPTQHKGVALYSREMEELVQIAYKASIEDFNVAWALLT
jgi:hypothetical protein